MSIEVAGRPGWAELAFHGGQAWALYARGLAKQKMGDSSGGASDMSAARKLRADVMSQVTMEGLQP